MSNSNTDRLSAAQLPAANCLIPSSVINSQCESVCKMFNWFYNLKFINLFRFYKILQFLITNFSKLGQPVAKCDNVKSVIWLHSSKSMRSKYLQLCKIKLLINFILKMKKTSVHTLPNAWKPKSVNWWQPATSKVFKYGLFCANDVSDWSVNSAHLETHSFLNWRQVSAIFTMDTSVTLYKIFTISIVIVTLIVQCSTYFTAMQVEHF